MLSTLHNQQGVSLIELMIALVIAAILLTMGAPAISEWVQSMRIRNAADSIVNGLQLTRAEAVKRNTMVYFQLSGDTTSIDTSWTSCASTDSTSACPAASLVQSYSSSEGSTGNIEATLYTHTPPVTPDNLSDTRTLFFNGLGRMTTAVTSNNATIVISNRGVDNCLSDPAPGTMKCMRVLVSPGGQIRLCNPLFDLASNPQGCPAS